MSGSDIIEAPETPEPDVVTDEGPEPTPLLCPAEGVPALSVTADDIAAALGLSSNKARYVLDVVLKAIKTRVRAGHSVELRGLDERALALRTILAFLGGRAILDRLGKELAR